MTAQENETTSTHRVRDYRKGIGEQGVRRIQMSVMDVPAPSFALDAHRQSAVAAASDRAEDDQAFIDALCLDG